VLFTHLIHVSTNVTASVVSVEMQQETFQISSYIPQNKYCVSDVMNLAVLWRLGSLSAGN